MMPGSGGPRVILYLEDDDATSYIFHATVKDCCSEPGSAAVHRVISTDEALRFLRQEKPYDDMPRPHVVVLDINVPGDTGFSVLKAMRSDPQLASIPVIMFSSSLAAADRVNAQQLGADEFLTKSFDLAGFVAAARTTLRFAGVPLRASKT
jgi:CheY-like chemotaxis protein